MGTETNLTVMRIKGTGNGNRRCETTNLISSFWNLYVFVMLKHKAKFKLSDE